ncbi:MAG: hypothetical protein ACI9OJ_001815 [Myxococcota bacterium]|jgi:hypothetical protein
MRIVLLIVMVLAVVVSAGLGIMVGQKNLHSEEGKALAALAEATKDAKDSKTHTIAAGFQKSGWGGYVVGGLAVLLLVVAFAKKWSAIAAIGGLGILASIAFIILSPSFETGATGGMAPRGQAMVYGIAFVVAALSAMGAEKIRMKKLMGDDAF